MVELSKTGLTRVQLDEFLSKYCEIFSIEYSTLHDDAFCIKFKNTDWIFLWYNSDDNELHSFIQDINDNFGWYST